MSAHNTTLQLFNADAIWGRVQRATETAYRNTEHCLDSLGDVRLVCIPLSQHTHTPAQNHTHTHRLTSKLK